MKKRLTSVLFFILFYSSPWISIAQIPPGYYNPANGKTGTALQSALHNIIKDHNSVSYGWSYFQNTDKKSDGTVWDMYSDIPGGTPPYVYHFGTDQCGNYNSEGDCYNREHSWPNSWFGGEVYPMYSDLFHLYPTDGYVNGKRSNYPYGQVGSASWTSMNGGKLGSCTWTGYSGVVFEPVDAYKGDFARSYFYMSVRYYTEDNGWPGSDMVNGSQLKPWALALMMQWSSQDPVSQKETDRNNAVYQIQNNRNPFIDHPEYADYIWGNGVGIDPVKEQGKLTIYPNPAGDFCYINLPVSSSKGQFQVSLYNLTGNEIKVVFKVDGDHISVNLTSLQSGFFFVKMIDGKNAVFNGLILKK